MSTTPDTTLIVARAELATVLRDRFSSDPGVSVFSVAEASQALAMSVDGSTPVIALDRHFVASRSGAQFLCDVRESWPAVEIRILTEKESDVAVLLQEGTYDTAREAIVAGSNALGEVRRAPRFPVATGLEAIVNGEPADLVNVSVNGAQLVSPRILKPTQYIRLALPDDADALKVEGEIAWSMFERSAHTGRTCFRAGVALMGVDAMLMEAYCVKYGITGS